jgi:hypothetical protein
MKGAGDMVHLIDHLPGKSKAQSLTHSTIKEVLKIKKKEVETHSEKLKTLLKCATGFANYENV